MSLDIAISIVTFILGIVFGWFINHWYSVNMTIPKLSVNGGGGGKTPLDPNLRSVHLSVENELRHLGIRIPTTIILGKQLKTYFWNQVKKRDTARKCTANLLDENGKYICQLWWNKDKEIATTMNIESGEKTNLIVFLNKEGKSGYFPYQPNSQIDPKPKLTRVPNFNEPNNFSITISYAYGSKSLILPIKVTFNYDGNVYFEYKGGSSFFYERKIA